jgi:hypothetical protein
LRTLGLACDKASYSWCLLVDTNEGTVLEQRAASKLPLNTTRAEELLWQLIEVQNLVDRLQPDRAVLKRAETGGSARSAPLDHSEMDGVTLAALASRSIPVESLKWATIASRLGKRSKSDALAIVRGFALAEGVPASHLDAIAAATVARTL